MCPPADAFNRNARKSTNAFPHLSAINIGFSGSLNGWCLCCAAGLEVCRGGGDTFVHMESGRDLPIIYPETISHTQQAAHGWRRLKLALLSGCHTASCARSQLAERLLWGYPGRAILSFCSPQHPFDVSAAFGVLRPTVRKREPVGTEAGQFSLLSSSQLNFPSERTSIKLYADSVAH